MVLDLISTSIIVFFSSLPWLYLFKKVYEDPDRIEKWVSIFYRLFSWAGLKYEKRGIAKDIQSDLKRIAKKVNAQTTENLLPYGIRIDWKEEETKATFIKNKNVVVRMRHHSNQAKNFLIAGLSYSELGLIPHARKVLDDNVNRAIELVFSSKIFIDSKRHDVLQLFNDSIYNPETQKNPTLERYCNVMDGLEKNGHFTRIALEEFFQLGNRMTIGISKRDVELETVGFTEALERLVNRDRGEDTSPDYVGQYIKISVVLIARREKIQEKGVGPYLAYINGAYDSGVETFYLCAIGNQNVRAAIRISDAYADSPILRKTSGDEYSLNDGTNAICCILQKVR